MLLILVQDAWSQDSTKIVKKDSTSYLRKHIPSTATKRSALIPGWGQAYNKQYWKIPLVYGIISIPAATYIYNNDMYVKTKFAYEARFKESKGDASDVAKIDPLLTNLSASSLQSYRNIFRKDRDYSIMWFILTWGINVIDATVSGHLKEFDINNDLSFKIQPTYQPQYKQAGLALQFHFNNHHSR
ncbi:MAG: DUF5683 domain-containing protein [Sediminibacterium sp.]|jgi:hypothetical protein